MQANTCRRCLWWDGAGPARGVGRCRRNSPVPADGETQVLAYARWPLTLADDWCGEWQPPAMSQVKG